MSNLDERICVVGGGISGLTAAYCLQKKGYTNVTLLEGNSRIGGKCYSIKYRGKTYEMGTMMGVPSHKHIVELMKELGMKNNGPLLYKGFFDNNGRIMQQIQKEDIRDFRSQYMRLPEELKKYEILQEPGFKNLTEDLCQPFSKWCDDRDLSVMKSVFAPAFTAFGFGYLEDVPTAYVLKFLEYETLTAFVEITHLITWTEGIQEMLERIADCLDDVRLTSRVIRIERKEDVEVQTTRETLHFDKIIITSPLDDTLKYMDSTKMEKQLFNKIKYQDFRVFSYKVEGLPQVTGYMLENIRKERLGHVMVWYYRWGDRGSNDLINVYALASPELSNETIKARVEEDLIQMGVKIKGSYININWRHFPHVDSEVLLDGFYDKLDGIQGSNNTYYAGEIMNFSSIEKCTQYSKYLIEKYF